MTTAMIALCMVLGVLCVIAGVGYLLLRGANNLAEVAETLPVAPVVQAEPPRPVKVTEPVKAEPKIRLRLVSHGGRYLGETVIPAKQRRNSFTYRVGKAKELSNFVASQRLPNGEWEYRRVGVERE
jgi:hypothetical protein